MHHEMLKQQGERLHLKLELKHLKEIAELVNQNAYYSYMNYLTKREAKIQSNFISQRHRKMNNEKNIKQKLVDSEPHIFYGLGQNSIMIRHYNQVIDESYNWKAVREFHDWGQPLVLDFSFFNEFNHQKTLKSMMYKEVANTLTNNREARTPFQLHFTGVTGKLKEHLLRAIPNVCDPTSSINVTSQSHLDMFPPERLVYLSPDSRNDLLHFNHDDIYVIGAIVDRGDRQPLTLSRAKRLKIRHARLPMKRVKGIKADLNIDTCLAIMADMKASDDWFYSFRWVPGRYLFNRSSEAEGPLVGENGLFNEHQRPYIAHRALSPTCKDMNTGVKNKMMSPRTYRDMYRRLMKARTSGEMDEILNEWKV